MYPYFGYDAQNIEKEQRSAVILQIVRKSPHRVQIVIPQKNITNSVTSVRNMKILTDVWNHIKGPAQFLSGEKNKEYFHQSLITKVILSHTRKRVLLKQKKKKKKKSPKKYVENLQAI